MPSKQRRRGHAGKPGPVPTPPPHQNRLGLIVGRVAGHDDIGAGFDRRLREQPVARLAGGGGYARGRLPAGPGNDAVIDAVRGGQPPDGFRFGPGFTAQSVIDRHREQSCGRGHTIELLFQEKKQGSGVAASGYRDDDRPAPLGQASRNRCGKGAQTPAQQAASACSCFTRSLRAAEAPG